MMRRKVSYRCAADRRPEGGRYDELVQLLCEHRDWIHSYIFSRLQNRADTDDVCQETCIRILEQAQQWDQRGNFKSWACVIAHYQILTYRRRKKRDRQRILCNALDLLSHEVPDCASKTNSREHALMRQMRSLDKKSRYLLRLSYWEGMSVQEIARVTHQSDAAIYKSLQRARRSLKNSLNRYQKGRD